MGIDVPCTLGHVPFNGRGEHFAQEIAQFMFIVLGEQMINTLKFEMQTQAVWCRALGARPQPPPQ